LGEGTSFIVKIPLGKAHLPPDQISVDAYAIGGSNAGTAYVEEALRWLPSSGNSSSEDVIISTSDCLFLCHLVRSLINKHREIH